MAGLALVGLIVALAWGAGQSGGKQQGFFTVEQSTNHLGGGAALLAAALWSTAGVFSSPAQAGEQERPRYAYLIDACAGGYYKVDTETQKIVAQGTVADDPSTAPIQLGKTSGAECVISNLQYDPQAGMIYGLAPDQQQPPDAEGNSYHWIVGLRLPNFALVSKTLKPTRMKSPRPSS